MKKIFQIIGMFRVVFWAIFAIYLFDNGTEPEVLFKKYARPESKLIEIDGQKIHYRETGSGEPLILLHGVSSSLLTWDVWHKELSKDFRVISIDVPGFGISGPFLNDDYSYDNYMLFLEKLLTKLNIEKCYMAGNSFGGSLTYRFALKNPNKVKKIAILDASGFEKSNNSIGFILSETPVISIFSHYFTPKPLIEMTVKDLYGDLSKLNYGVVNSYYELLLRKGNRQAFTKVLQQINDYDAELPKKLNQIKTPTLVLWGEKDNWYYPAIGKKFKSHITNSKLIVYSGVGHMPMEENPIESAKDFRDFVFSEK
jgi:pimeloyl-ACP methyl ester carboxylesterase